MENPDEILDDNQFLELHQKVVNSGLYNFEGWRIPLQTRLNIPFFRFMLSDYDDLAVCEFLEFGFPIGFLGKVKPRTGTVKNHKGVTEFPVEVRRYLEKEKGYHAILGSFKEIPFPSEFCISPLNKVSKKDSLERRIILDLSFPEGSAVNELIPKDYYLDTKVNLTFPRMDDLLEIIKKLRGNVVICLRGI